MKQSRGSPLGTQALTKLPAEKQVPRVRDHPATPPKRSSKRSWNMNRSSDRKIWPAERNSVGSKKPALLPPARTPGPVATARRDREACAPESPASRYSKRPRRPDPQFARRYSWNAASDNPAATPQESLQTPDNRQPGRHPPEQRSEGCRCQDQRSSVST